MKIIFRVLGGYDGPRWRIDRRPQPLRSRRTSQRFRTLLRREAVIRLKLEGKSFREIGRELRVSHVAAWKLWGQIVTDIIEQVRAEHSGAVALREAHERALGGDDQALWGIHVIAAAGVGVQATRRLLGSLDKTSLTESGYSCMVNTDAKNPRLSPAIH